MSGTNIYWNFDQLNDCFSLYNDNRKWSQIGPFDNKNDINDNH